MTMISDQNKSESHIMFLCPSLLYPMVSYRTSVRAVFTGDRICSHPFGIGSTIVLIHSVYRAGSELERYGSIWDHLRKWSHLVRDSRSNPYRIHQVPCKYKAYPYYFRTGFVLHLD